ncbi:MAG: non-homologous end-joining DNA ligase [Acidimicrobiia bacterium]
MAPPVVVNVGGRELSLSNLDKVLYPAIGFTKAEVVDYYARIAPVLLTHVEGRCITFKRFPNGVDDKSFFEKRCPSHRPEWVHTAVGPGDRGSRGGPGGEIRYCVLDEPAALVWAANLAALELHAPMARSVDLETPTMIVFDLDPGPPAAIRECASVALDIADVLDKVGLRAFPKTSGSKGMQLYVPLNTPCDHEHASQFALAVGQLLERLRPKDVVTTMAKAVRPNKVFVDWSQNARFKTTIAPYSLRARERPTVSTPITWDEVQDGADGEDPLVFDAADVLARVEEFGDLFAETATLRQELPY